MANNPQTALKPTAELAALGQSIWYDNIRRGLIESGELQTLIDEYGVVGVTSNPAIFQQAIGESDDYDSAMRHMLDLDPEAIYERLALEDIQRALDMLRPVYERTQGRDGFVSLEVSPLLAHNTEKTIEAATRLFAALDRPNAMIKIPATKEGIPAIEDCIAAGININVTLIFSVKNYIQVAEAYIRGLERRLNAGQDVTRVASVASFFLSRIDTMVDRMLENNIRAAQGRDLSRVSANSRLLGKIAIANAKLAYRRFTSIFYGERFARLREAGARVQRPLWASTSVKNPAYPDTMYVDSVIGPDTVNTMPPQTLLAFHDHGTAAETLTQEVHEAEAVLRALNEAGIDIDQVTARLQEDGVDAFIEAYENLIDQVRAKRTVLRTGVMDQQKLALGIYARAVQQALGSMDRNYINPRIWAHDATVWKDHVSAMAKIHENLGWLDIRSTISMVQLKAFQQDVQQAGFGHIVFLGMGGVSLGVQAMYKAFGRQAGYPDFILLDTTNPAYIRHIQTQIDPAQTLFIVESKSGATVETQMLCRYFYHLTGKNGAQFVAVTDAGSPLDAQAQAHNFRRVFHNPPDMNGAYSMLTYYGLVPLAAMGLDLDRVWSEVERMMDACGESIAAVHHPGMWLGAVIGALTEKGRDKLSLHGSQSAADFTYWAEYVLAEGTGKEGRGLIPIAGATVGKPHDYTTDRQFVYLKLEGDPDTDTLDAEVRSLREAGHPRVTLLLKDKYALAGEFFRWQFAAAVAAQLLRVNPFETENVEESKRNVARIIGHYKHSGELPADHAVMSREAISLYSSEDTLAPLRELCSEHGYDSGSLVEVLAAQLIGTMSGDYFGLLAYLPPLPEVDSALKEIRRRLRHVTRRAVTAGYGPRYLHGTGQLHKGGPNKGIFLILSCDCSADVSIPDEAFTFGLLHLAQAAGDLAALHSARRRALRLHVQGDDPQPLFDLLLAAIDHAEQRRH